MWFETIFPCDASSSIPSVYVQEFIFEEEFPTGCLGSPLLHRFYKDTEYDEACFLDQGFYKLRSNVFLRMLTREEFIFILDQYLNFNF